MFESQWKQTITCILAKMYERLYRCSSSIIFAEKNLTQPNYRLDEYYIDFAPLISLAEIWFIEFYRCRINKSVIERSGCPIEVYTSEPFESYTTLSDIEDARDR